MKRIKRVRTMGTLAPLCGQPISVIARFAKQYYVRFTISGERWPQIIASLLN